MLLLFLLYISFLNWLTIAEACLPLLDVGLVLRLGSLACVLRWRRTLAFGRMEGRRPLLAHGIVSVLRRPVPVATLLLRQAPLAASVHLPVLLLRLRLVMGLQLSVLSLPFVVSLSGHSLLARPLLLLANFLRILALLRGLLLLALITV